MGALPLTELGLLFTDSASSGRLEKGQDNGALTPFHNDYLSLML